jgi:hypothetical protein
VFNRAIELAYDDGEEVQRIHRACRVLEAAASDGADYSAERGATGQAKSPDRN